MIKSIKLNEPKNFRHTPSDMKASENLKHASYKIKIHKNENFKPWHAIDKNDPKAKFCAKHQS